MNQTRKQVCVRFSEPNPHIAAVLWDFGPVSSRHTTTGAALQLALHCGILRCSEAEAQKHRKPESTLRGHVKVTPKKQAAACWREGAAPPSTVWLRHQDRLIVSLVVYLFFWGRGLTQNNHKQVQNTRRTPHSSNRTTSLAVLIY